MQTLDATPGLPYTFPFHFVLPRATQPLHESLSCLHFIHRHLPGPGRMRERYAADPKPRQQNRTRHFRTRHAEPAGQIRRPDHQGKYARRVLAWVDRLFRVSSSSTSAPSIRRSSPGACANARSTRKSSASTPRRQETIAALRTAKGLILSGGPASVYGKGAPQIDPDNLRPRHSDSRHLLRHAAHGLSSRRQSRKRHSARREHGSGLLHLAGKCESALQKKPPPRSLEIWN